MKNTQETKLAKGMIGQPIKGLLYDLDLMPEQCVSWTANAARLVIEILYKQKEWLIHHYAKDMVIDNRRLDDHGIDDLKKEIIDDMHQSLKGGLSD